MVVMRGVAEIFQEAWFAVVDFPIDEIIHVTWFVVVDFPCPPSMVIETSNDFHFKENTLIKYNFWSRLI